MSFDNSRFTFDPTKNYSGVVVQQGRVQMDADWNEWLAELSRRIQAGTLDTMGRAAYPATTPYAFQITASSSAGSNALTIGPGRMYVDGLLAENHGDPKAARWDPALSEMSDSPQPPPATETGAIDYTQQPYMPAGTTLPAGNGPFLAYLDVWIRPVTYLEDPDLVDKAVGIDSTGRLQTVWQVKMMDLANSPGATCGSAISGWPPPSSGGLLSTGTAPSIPSGPCCLSPAAAYTGIENQFYRVEIHRPGSAEASGVPPTSLAAGTATFKWSRDNASVMTAVTSIANVTNSAGKSASQLSVQSLGRDQVLGFAPGNWIEILDDNLEFGGQPGELHQIDTVDFAAKTVTLAKPLTGFVTGNTDPKVHTRIRRWDQSGKIYEQDGTTVWWDLDAQGTGDIPVPPAGTSLLLENGITVIFSMTTSGGSSLLTADFWTFAARTADGSVEKLHAVPPRDIHHHYARLSIVTFPNSATDCRTKWPPSTTSEEHCGCCCTCTVGDGVESVGQYSSINDAINALPVTGGEVCILPGRYFEHVFIEGRRDVVLRGCGWQTRIASPSLKPTPPPAAPAIAERGSAANTASATPIPPYAAVITVSSSQHVQLLSFAVEAAKDEVGILLDGIGKLSAGQQPRTRDTHVTAAAIAIGSPRVVDTTIKDLVITASTLPAILASRVTLLQIEKNRIAMQDVRSMWPAVWVSGIEIRIVHNWVGMQMMTTSRLHSATPDSEWLPVTVTGDLLPNSNTGAAGTSLSPSSSNVPVHPGGIQIAGPSRDVFVVENEIDRAGRNGITLGSLSILDAKGKDTGQITGVTIVEEGPCDTTITLQVPGTGPGQQGGKVVASDKLINIQINRNRIRNCGLCGIGPVGFFDLLQTLEVISIENLTISANTVSATVLGTLAAFLKRASTFGYAAICVPDVENLVLRDNNITDFGPQPGAQVCGIFILNGQMVEISRNHVLETRDWNLTSSDEVQSGGALRGGIVVLLATPPTFTTPASFNTNFAGVPSPFASPAYEPGLPALRVEHNVVRVPLGEALVATGYGAYSIVNNHLGCGGTVKAAGRPLAETVLILNLGTALEVASAAGTFSAVSQGKYASSGNVNRTSGSAGGAVIFTNNVCQLEARVSGRHCISSVMIFSLDDLIFANNQCRLDGPERTASVDAWLLAGSLQVTGNRFQEALGFPVFASGLTIGALNITTENISTYCLFAKGTLQPEIDTNNLVAVTNKQTCDALARQLNL
ncbi:MAG TPA: DUF6519 domain-containing protein [Candidatus Acidoferrum sp.]|nr:DUF6519 domain-containing protein [Candidatus Acidoferrum sp.]